MTHGQDVAGPAGHILVCGSQRTSTQAAFNSIVDAGVAVCWRGERRERFGLRKWSVAEGVRDEAGERCLLAEQPGRQFRPPISGSRRRSFKSQAGRIEESPALRSSLLAPA